METDRLVGYGAITEDRDDYGVLPPKANQLMTRLRRIAQERAATDERLARHCTGALDRLRSFLLQVRRMDEHAEALRKSLKAVAAESRGDYTFQAAHQGDSACTDFESLLFHGKAALDRMTIFVAAAHNQRLDRFNALAKFLAQTAPQVPAVKALRPLLAECDAINGSLVDLGEGSLRSRVTHRSSLTEGVVSHFTILTRQRGRVLVLDCEAFGYGVLTQSRRLGVEVPFLVLNALKLYVDAPKPLTTGSFRRKHLPVVRVSDFATDDETKPYVHLVKIEPGGAVVRQQHVDPAMFRLARKI